MGCFSSKPTAERESSLAYVEEKIGRAAVSARYHRLPRRVSDDYVLLDTVLGEGAFSVVKLAMDEWQTHSYAVKTIPTRSFTKEEKAQLELEVDILLGMDHRHVVRLFDVYEEEHHVHLVMEHMQGRELFDRVAEVTRFTEAEAVEIARQVLLAVNYLHMGGIAHRDLKLDNFMFLSQDSNHLKLIDFGLAQHWDPSVEMSEGCGTTDYLAPEVIEGSYTIKADVWSCGIIIFILLAGYMPFGTGGVNDILANIKAGQYTLREDRWGTVSKEALQFVQALLTVDADKRLSAKQALEHPWIAKSEEQSQSKMEPIVVEALRDFAAASIVRRVCKQMMAWSLTYQEREAAAKQFLALDAEKRGTIALSDMKGLLVAEGRMSEEEAETVAAALDSNCDETVHYSDFLAAMLGTSILSYNPILLTRTFKRFDQRSRGFLTLEALQEMLGGETFQGEEVSSMFDEVDLLKDDKITCVEFFAFLTNEPLEPADLADTTGERPLLS